MADVIMLRPEVSFAQIHWLFLAAGWRGGATVATPPLVPAEPELAVWRRERAVVRYECNPVVWLRVLRPSGAAATLPVLPALTATDVLALLQGPAQTDAQAGRVLLGILAARESKLPEAVPLLHLLADGRRNPTLARFARLALA
jgi:hypothetical protein